jgi:enolase
MLTEPHTFLSTAIKSITARKIFNIRGEETIEVDVTTAKGWGRASAPAGASRGKGEAISYPKGDVGEAVKKVTQVIATKLIGIDAQKQEKIDTLLHQIDGTDDFRNIGGNTSYAVSLAVAEAAASSNGAPLFQQLAGRLANELPHPLGNVLGGGKHARANAPDIQEFLALPIKVGSFFQAVKSNIMVHETVGIVLEKKDATFTGGRTDEGAWAPNIGSDDALDIVVSACNKVSDETGVKISPGMDMAASSFWSSREKQYVYKRDNIKRDVGEQLDFVTRLIKTYKLVYVEDPFHEEDFSSFAALTKKVKNCLVCGDDLFVTNIKRLQKGIKMGAANATIIKGNQVGTLTDAWKATLLAQKAGYVPIMSHRSGETTESHIAHLSVAFRCPIIKAGVVEGARTAILNELIRIEETLKESAKMSALTL